MPIKFVNDIQTAIATVGGIDSEDTEIDFTAGAGALLMAQVSDLGTGSVYVKATLKDDSGNRETIKITEQVSADKFTIERAQEENDIARAWSEGDVVDFCLSKSMLEDIQDEAAAAASAAADAQADIEALEDVVDGKQDILAEGAFVAGDKTKLDAIESGADVTDATNVAAAGAVMTSGIQTIAGVKTFSSIPVGPASDPTTDNQLVRKKYIDDLLPTVPVVLEIGDWNMQSGGITVLHHLDYTKIIGVRGSIRNDADTGRYPLGLEPGGSVTFAASISGWTSTYIQLIRLLGGAFDSVNFNATGYNRGWLIVDYLLT